MEYSIQNLSKTKVEIAFSVDKEQWHEDINTAYIKNKHKYMVEGFRKGKVPRSILERRYGIELFFEDALDIALQKYYGEIMEKEQNLYPVSQPEVDVQDISADGLKVVITVEVKPEVILGVYKDIEVERNKTQITDEQIEAEVQRAREAACRWIDIDNRPVQEGDRVNLDYSGSVNGEKFEGGTAQKQFLTIGSKTFIPGFEEQLIGMNIGETKDINVKFPEEYHAELAGKDAVFTVTINEIKIKELPEADDEFAKDVSDFDTLAEYKADIAKRLAERADEEAEMKAENELLEKIVSASEAEAPQSMIEAEMDDMIKELEYRMMYQGLKLEDFLKYSGQTMEGLREERKDDAEKSVKTRLVIEKIIETENLQISAEEMEAKMQELAKAQNKSVEEYKKTADKNAFVRIMNRMLSEKFFNFLKENNKITIKE